MNYATEDVYGTHPVTGQRILIAKAGQPIPEQFDSLVAAEDKTASAPSQAAVADGDEATLAATFPAVAAGVDADQVIGEVPFDGTVIGVSYTPEANIAGADTNSRTLTVVNKGADGNGNTVIATLDLVAGAAASDFDEKALALSAVAGALDVAEGDVLAFVSTHVGTGIADPGGQVQVKVEPR